MIGKKSKDAPYRNLLANIRYTSRKKNIYFDLSFEDFKRIVSSSCHYCGKKPSNTHRERYHPPLKYSGIDRKNNSQGYYLSNCVPACHECNSLKSDKLSYEETKQLALALKRIRSRLKRKK